MISRKVRLSLYSEGFTLLELLTTIAIVAILSAIAVSWYSTYTAKTNQNKVKSILLDTSSQLDRWRSKTLSYYGFTPADSNYTSNGYMTYPYPLATGQSAIYKIYLCDPATNKKVNEVGAIARQWEMWTQNSKGYLNYYINNHSAKCTFPANTTYTCGTNVPCSNTEDNW